MTNLPGLEPRETRGTQLPKLQPLHAPLIHPDRSCLLVGVGAEATPPPLLRRFHQPTLHRISMHISKLLHPLACRADVEIVVPRLPDVLRAVLEQVRLPTAAVPPLLR